MSLVAIVNLAERILNQKQGLNQEPQSGSPAQGARVRVKSAWTSDQFVSSQQGAQAASTAESAGLFHGTQFTMFSAAADFLLAQSAATAALANGAANPTSLATPPIPISANTASATTGVGIGSTALEASSAAVAPTPPPLSTSTATTTTLNTPDQLQTLNKALTLLGLPQADLVQINRIGSLIKDFNPAAFTDLVHQLEAAAKSLSSQSPTTETIAANRATGTANNAHTNNRGLHIQELVIRFSGVEAPGTIGTAASGTDGRNAGSNFQVSASNQQIQEVNLTLGNNNGQTVRVQAPRSTASSAPAGADQSARKAKAAAR